MGCATEFETAGNERERFVKVEETGEAYGKLVKLEEMTGLVAGDTCEEDKVEEEVAGDGAEEAAVGEVNDGGADVEPVGEQNGVGVVMVDRRARGWNVGWVGEERNVD